MSTDPNVIAAMRLAPLDRPRGLWQRLLWLYFRMRFGKVMAPLRVMLPRIPRYTPAYVRLIFFAERGLSLSPRIRHLIELRVSQRNGCSFCSDLHQAMALAKGHDDLLFDSVDGYESDSRYDEPTRWALRYADEVVETHSCSDATFEAVREHFGEQQTVELAWLVAFTNFHNMLARPLGLVSDGFCDIVRAQRGLQPPA
ncbi:MAG: carboxymuconolactone decarboxylase family protein [Myxococcales bacterium]|nr:carboxymuconolactone decarboxylase family protein [Myxococcales bacterium]